MKVLRSLLSILVFVAAAAHVHADHDDAPGLRLTTGKLVYQSGSTAGKVQFTLVNDSSSPVTLNNATTWKVLQIKQVVVSDRAATPKGTVLKLQKGQSQSWVWDKKDSKGNWVTSGTYTILMDPITLSNGSKIPLYQTVALTPDGRIDGKNEFPLHLGNRWEYRGMDGTLDKMYVSLAGKDPKNQQPWFKVNHLLGAGRFVRIYGKTHRSLMASPQATGGVSEMFRFNAKIGTTYKINFAPFLQNAKMSVHAVNGVFDTRAGRFTNCYELKTWNKGYMTFAFAPGVGLVHYQRPVNGKLVTFSLEHATVFGTPSNKLYTIGRYYYKKTGLHQ